MKLNIGNYPGSKSLKERKIDIRIDRWDTWNMNSTLALIITPMLEQLKSTKQGTPFTDDVDAPERFQGEAVNKEDGDIGDISDIGYNQDRWDWILDEMIWAFKQQNDETEYDTFFHNRDQLKMNFVKDDKYKGCSRIEFDYQKDPDKPAYYTDDEAIKAYEARKSNGYRLFGKYFEALWD